MPAPRPPTSSYTRSESMPLYGTGFPLESAAACSPLVGKSKNIGTDSHYNRQSPCRFAVELVKYENVQPSFAGFESCALSFIRKRCEVAGKCLPADSCARLHCSHNRFNVRRRRYRSTTRHVCPISDLCGYCRGVGRYNGIGWINCDKASVEHKRRT